MPDAWTTAFTALAITFVAEVGDKTQIVLLALAARGARWRVLVGAVLAFAALTTLTVYVADAVAAVVSPTAVRIIGASLFLLFAALALRQAMRAEHDEHVADEPRQAGLVAAFGLVFVAELGDKTQIAAAALAAAQRAPLATAVGATVGFAVASTLAVLAGAWLGRHVSDRVLAYGAAVAFGLVGLVLLLSLVW